MKSKIQKGGKEKERQTDKQTDFGGRFSFSQLVKTLDMYELVAGHQWLMPVIPATQEAEIRRIVV
jgi:hypothetical protein